jgi:hypothetical protein
MFFFKNGFKSIVCFEWELPTRLTSNWSGSRCCEFATQGSPRNMTTSKLERFGTSWVRMINPKSGSECPCYTPHIYSRCAFAWSRVQFYARGVCPPSFNCTFLLVGVLPTWGRPVESSQVVWLLSVLCVCVLLRVWSIFTYPCMILFHGSSQTHFRALVPPARDFGTFSGPYAAYIFPRKCNSS